MSQPNPFDEVSKRPRREVRRGFEASAKLVDLQVKLFEASAENRVNPRINVEVTTGEDYLYLQPESMQLVQQDFLDDERFAHVERPGLKFIKNTQERERAARAICRRHPELSEQVIPVMLDNAERAIRVDRKTGWLWSIIGLFTLYFFCDQLIEGRGIIAAVFVGGITCAFCFAVFLVSNSLWNMGSATGKAV